MAFAGTVRAQLTYDANPGGLAVGPQDGAGVWDTTTANWWNSAGLGGNVLWANTATSDATFGNPLSLLTTAGIVTVSNVIVNDITFAKTGYTLEGGTIALSGTTPRITTGAGIDATINSVLAGSPAYSKEGAGTLTIGGSAANTASGVAAVNGGTLVLNKTAGMNAIAGNLTIAAGTVRLDNSGQIADTSVVNLSNAAGVLNLNGWNETVGSLAGVATSKVTLGSGTLTVQNTTATTFAGVISGTGGGLVKNGTAAFTLSGSNTYTGATTVNTGTLTAGSTSAFGSGSAVTITGPGILSLVGFNNSIGSLSGSGTLSLGTGILTTGSANTSTTFSGTSTGTTGGITKIGLGTQTLGGISSHSGATTVSAGTLMANSITALSATSAMIVATGATLDLNDFNNSVASLAGGGNVTLGTATLTTGSTASSTFSGVISETGKLTKVGTGTQTLTGTNTHTGVTTISAGGLTLNNPTGNAIIGGPNDTTADIIVGTSATVATLTLGASNQIGDTANIAFNGASGASSFNLAGFTETVGTLSSANTASTLVLGTNGGITVQNGVSAPTTFAGIISGNGGDLTKNGAGTFTLTGANTYTGATSVTEGTLILTKESRSANISTSLGAVTEFSVTSGTVDDGTAATSLFSGDGTLRKTGHGVLMWGVQPGTFSMGTGSLIDLQAGTTWFGHNGNVSPGPEVFTSNLSDLTVATGATLIQAHANVRVDAVNGGGFIEVGFGTNSFTLGVDNGSGTFTGIVRPITGFAAAGILVKEGTGIQVLTGNNTYFGTTLVSAGTLQIGAAGVGTSGRGTFTVQSGGTLSGTGVLRGTIFNAETGSTIQPGDGVDPDDYGTLTFQPSTAAGTATTGTHTIKAGSLSVLGIATTSTSDPTFGNNVVGTPGYNAYIAGAAGTGTMDVLNFQGTSVTTLTFSGNIKVDGTGYAAPMRGDVFDIINWGAGVTSRNFTGFAEGANYRDGSGDNGSQFDLPDLSSFGLQWDVSHFKRTGKIVVVPEPVQISLIGFGAATLLFHRRRAA